MAEISQAALEEFVNVLLDRIFDRRIEKLSDLQLRKVLLKKNPYLYRAIGSGDATSLVKLLLDATISSSDETIFGNEFFEPLVLWAADQAQLEGSVAHSSSAEGADVDVEYPNEYRMYAVKSGTAVFNAASWKKQVENFRSASLRMAKTKKRFDGVVAYGYGRNPSHSGAREVAGQALWEELSGDPTFYQRIMQAVRSGSQERQNRFRVEYDKALNRFLRELLANFSTDDGALDWEKLLAYNSAKQKPNPKDWKIRS